MLQELPCQISRLVCPRLSKLTVVLPAAFSSLKVPYVLARVHARFRRMYGILYIQWYGGEYPENPGVGVWRTDAHANTDYYAIQPHGAYNQIIPNTSLLYYLIFFSSFTLLCSSWSYQVIRPSNRPHLFIDNDDH